MFIDNSTLKYPKVNIIRGIQVLLITSNQQLFLTRLVCVFQEVVQRYPLFYPPSYSIATPNQAKKVIEEKISNCRNALTGKGMM